MIHTEEKIKCDCGSEYCKNCLNGCSQCGKGRIEFTTTTSTISNVDKKVNTMLKPQKITKKERLKLIDFAEKEIKEWSYFLEVQKEELRKIKV